MSFLIRVLLSDTPGSLALLAEALGLVEANIQSVDVVERFPNGTVMDDLVISIPRDVMADTIITAAEEVDGVEVDSIRPFSGTVDRRGQIHMLASVAQQRRNVTRAMEEMVDVIPRTMTSGWALVIDLKGTIARIAGSQAAPEDDGTVPENIELSEARLLNPENESWVPESWSLLDSSLAIAPIGKHGLALIIGRPGGPDFLASEVEHLGQLGTIIGAMLHK
ncbi:amino acid-binding ACT domain protein [Corynebacterium crudilactis]|uniref:Amino acid-binding ACT domain protein n=1 Tax=Corynebacterium crudilactis TaxID=1652495 RepID=A0A172QSX8_9CORY|nr:amino acid-binding ACT domain protein [Corynebacterium crudilactis]ANE03805.1 amino acid-binding ACT domain protein [Corynebacterium crudilactis]